MTDAEVRNAYLIVGRDRRKAENSDTSRSGRKLMGRKGIGKFCAFGIAREIEIETIRNGEISRFVMTQDGIERHAQEKKLVMPALESTGTVSVGTKVALRKIPKFRNRSINVQSVRRGLARRFSVIGSPYDFEVIVNGAAISPTERDLKLMLEKDRDGKPYLWEFPHEEIRPNTGWIVSGWIGALPHTRQQDDGIQRGIVIMARGKLVQEPFLFEAVSGQQYALSYLVGELHADFVDETEDTISTARNSLVWDVEANTALREWGAGKVNEVARAWADKRREDSEHRLEQNQVYRNYLREAEKIGNARTKKTADNLIKKVIREKPLGTEEELAGDVQLILDLLRFDAFAELAEDLNKVDIINVAQVVRLFREWEIVEAREMMRVTDGRIKTIRKLEELIDANALEVPTIHNFLKQFPWVLDPRWTLVADEIRFSQLLRKEFPEQADEADADRRIDFLCVRESSKLVVVEIKRPTCKASTKQLDQIERYVNFMRDFTAKTTDPALRLGEVSGYLLCGDIVQSGLIQQKIKNLELADIYIRKYHDLLRLVENSHRDFLDRYEKLQELKNIERT